jgi:hypothetical protein
MAAGSDGFTGAVVMLNGVDRRVIGMPFLTSSERPPR